MIEFIDEIKNLLAKQKLGFVATVSPDNTPNLSPKGTIIVWNGDLIFADIKSPNTIANLQKNPSIEINVVDPLSRKGYRFKGVAKIISEGEEFDKIILHYKTQGIKSEINSIVSVKVESMHKVTSPLYDLGYSEEEIISKWKKHYLSF
jgi:uncharacterized protein